MCEEFDLTMPGGITLQLRRCASPDPTKAKPVLLLHGASANHATFLTGQDGGLAPWLAKQNYDVWLLDWRGSSRVVQPILDQGGLLGSEFNFNDAAEFDVPAALRKMYGRVNAPVAVLGHCMGGGVLAESIALGRLFGGDLDKFVDRAVLLTLGLFYETPIDGRIKSEERILERAMQTLVNKQVFSAMDPRIKDATGKLQNEWTPELSSLYDKWPGRKYHSALPNASADDDVKYFEAQHLCNRLSFMYGMPYHHDNLVDDIHGRIGDGNGGKGTTPVLQEQFGPIPLDMFIHASRNVREGRATWYRPDGTEPIVSDATRDRFVKKLDKITLITGALNRLWHRNSIDLMYEWLMRSKDARQNGEQKVSKHVLATYGHQDLLWGKRAPVDVFPLIERGLRS